MALSHRIIFVYHKSKNMSIILLLIGVSVLVAAAFLGAFLWSVKNGQMDDDYTPSIRMLFDDEIPTTKK